MIERVRVAIRPPRVGNYFVAPKEHLEFVPSGCKLLDLALGGGWAESRISNIVGDKSTGKTLLAIEAAATFVRKYEKKGKVRYREAEAAFDKPYAAALGMPVDRVDFGSEPMVTVEDLFEDLTKVIDGAHGPELYILDSLDALSDRGEMGREIDEGTFGAEKAKKMSQLFRRLTQSMAAKQVTLIIISQIRSKIGYTVGRKTTRQGGLALDFYASQVLYLSQVARLVKTMSGITRVVGISILAKMDKNKVSANYREAEFDVIFGYGVDDVRACLKWLDEAKSLKETGVSKDQIKTYGRSIQEWPDAEYYAELERIHEIVDRRWREVELGFLPPRRKYEDLA
jgi:recombination protein RecA